MSFSNFTSAWQGIAEFIVDLFQKLLDIFWTPASGSTPGSLTIIGYLAVISVGFAIVMKIYHLIVGFIQGI